MGILFSDNPLPAHIDAPENQLSLYADFKDTQAGAITLYLVNRTKETLKINAEDRDIYLKQEFKDEKGNWTRAEPHQYSWCGNSYMYPPHIKPDSYLKYSSLYPENGTRREIRYKRYHKNHPVVSNSGMGYVTPEKVVAAEHDQMAIRFGDFEFLSKIALGKHRVPESENN